MDSSIGRLAVSLVHGFSSMNIKSQARFWQSAIDLPVRIGAASRGALSSATVALLLIGLSANALADSVQLRNKGLVTGESINAKDGAPLVIKTYDGILMQLPNASVSSSTKSGEKEKLYVQSLNGRPDTAESNREIVNECKSRDQLTLAKAHLERVVEHDPKDGAAWSSLNYIFDNRTAEWIPKDLQNKRLGLVVFEKKRMTMHAAELQRAKNKIKEDGATFKRELERAIRYYSDNSKNGEAARAYIAALDDPRANPYLEKLILDSISARRDPQMLLSILLRMPKRSALKQYINICRKTDLLSVVDPILEELKSDEYMRVNAMLAFVGDLNSGTGSAKIEQTNRAGRNLEVLGDERVLPALIQRLKTGVQVKIQTAPTTSQQHGSGNVSHSTGGPKVVSSVVNQPGVLQALNAITGESFGYDQNAWRIWYANTYSSVNLDTRRFDE